jgi:hypothetical protein
MPSLSHISHDFTWNRSRVVLELELVPHKFVDILCYERLEKYKFGATSSGITFISNATELLPEAVVEKCGYISKITLAECVPFMQTSQRTFNKIIIIIVWFSSVVITIF